MIFFAPVTRRNEVGTFPGPFRVRNSVGEY